MNEAQIHGKEYHCWLKGKYLGKAIWTEETYMHSEAFIRMAINETGELVHQVFKVDKYYKVRN